MATVNITKSVTFGHNEIMGILESHAIIKHDLDNPRVTLNVEEVTEEYLIGNFESDTIVIGYKLSVLVEEVQ